MAEILAAHERAGSLAGLYGLAPPSPEASQQAAAAAEQANGPTEAEGPAEAADAVDWDAPLRPPAEEDGGGSGGGSAAAAAAAERAAAAGAGGGAPLLPAEQRRVVKLAELGLRFAEAAADSGHLGASGCWVGLAWGGQHRMCHSLHACA